MVNKYCSPNNKNNSHTCFSNSSLVKIASEYNKHNSKKIKVPKKMDESARKSLWNDVNKNMKKLTKCNEDHCILDTSIVKNMKDSDITEEFRPEMPVEWKKNPTTWLSTTDINSVMKQYEKNSDFVFLGSVPIDFDYDFGIGVCVSRELCSLNISELLKKGKTKIGVVFNLDPHYMSGSHWTALFSDLKTGGIYYFDSYGNKPPKEVQVLMQRIKTQGNDLIKEGVLNIDSLDDRYTQLSKYTVMSKRKIRVDNPEDFFIDTLVSFGTITKKDKIKIDKTTYNKIVNIKGNILTLNAKINCGDCEYIFMKSFRTFFNNNRFQFKNSECGVYSMHFIEEFLNGKDFETIISNIIHDDKINKKRKFYYRPS